MRKMKTIVHKEGLLHVETPNGIVNIYAGLIDRLGRNVDAVTVDPDKYKGEKKVKRVGYYNTRLIRLKTVTN